MGAASAWTQITGGDVTVAVVDTGVDLAHRDLAPNLWTNPGEIPGNGVDDDGDGIVDDVHGADFVNGDGDPSDDNGHGTHVAGIIAARGGNGVGVAGLAWRARIMAVKVLGADASGDMATVAAGVRYAVAHGARVVNLSLTGPSPGPDLAAAVEAAAAANVLVVAAAGNTRTDDDVVASYPPTSTRSTSWRSPRPISAAPWRRRPASGAPASTSPRPARRSSPPRATAATSCARARRSAAQVSGAAVLLASARPSLGWPGMRSALLGSARPTSLPVAAGRLNVAAALRRVLGGRRGART